MLQYNELHRRTVLHLFKSLTRSSTYLPLLLRPNQASLTKVFRDTLRKSFREEGRVTRNYSRAQNAIQEAAKWNRLLTQAYSDPAAVTELVRALESRKKELKEEERHSAMDRRIFKEFTRTERNENLSFNEFFEMYRANKLDDTARKQLSAEEQEHRDSARYHAIQLKKLRQTIPRKPGNNQPLFTQCVLTANRVHERDVRKKFMALKRLEKGIRATERTGSVLPQLTFHRPRHPRAIQDRNFGRFLASQFARHAKSLVKIKKLEKEVEEGKVRAQKAVEKGRITPAMAHKLHVTDALNAYKSVSQKLNDIKESYKRHHSIIMRRVHKERRLFERRRPKLIASAKRNIQQLEDDSNLMRLYK